MVYGDTNSTLAGAIAAAQAQLPVAHVEAGMRSFDRSMPEELNRVLADRTSDLLLCSTETAVENLRREGIDRFVDLGSGGGFPAIPLALALPADRLLLVESVGKKTRFLRVVLAAVGRELSAAIATDRAESIGRQRSDRGRWPAVTGPIRGRSNSC